MKFIQTIDLHTTRVEEIQALEKEWRAATEGRRTLRHSIVTQDRNDPDHYVVFAFFDDFESATVNSNLPETGEFGAKQAGLLDRPVTFQDLDVIEEMD